MRENAKKTAQLRLRRGVLDGPVCKKAQPKLRLSMLVGR
jgi:hypothetical protein